MTKKTEFTGVRLDIALKNKIVELAELQEIDFAKYVRKACQTQIDIDEGRAILIRDSMYPHDTEDLKKLIELMIDSRLEELGVEYAPKKEQKKES